MKKWIWIPVVISLILPMCSQKQATEEIPPVAEEMANKISLAIKNFEEGSVSEGAPQLLDVVLLTRPRSSWPDGFADAVESAKSSFKENNFSEGIDSVKKALKLFNPDMTEQTGETEGRITNLAEILRNKIQSATEKLKEGEADQAVILILESLLLLGPQQ